MKNGKRKRKQKTSLEFSVDFEGLFTLDTGQLKYLFPHFYSNGTWYWVNSINELKEMEIPFEELDQRSLLEEILDMHKKLSLLEKLEE